MGSPAPPPPPPVCTNPQQAQVKESSATGDFSTVVSSPTIIQYPRPPRNDTGRYVAIGSLLGTLVGRLANSGRISEASSAEDTWKSLNNQLANRGTGNWGRSDTEYNASTAAYNSADGNATNATNFSLADRTAGLGFETGTLVPRATTMFTQTDADRADVIRIEVDNVLPRAGILITRADEEEVRADSLSACLDSLHAKLCAYAECGYKPDYDGILMRAKADAQFVESEKIAAACRVADRYGTGMNADVACDIRRAGVLATVGTAAKLREDERQFMWKYKGELFSNTAKTFESHRNNRLQTQLAMTREALNAYENQQKLREGMARFNAQTAISTVEDQQRKRLTGSQYYDASAQRTYLQVATSRAKESLQWDSQAGQMVAGAGQNYAWLAESLRRTAQLDTGGFAAIGVALALAAGTFLDAPSDVCA